MIASQYEDEIREGLKGSHVEIFNKPVYQNFVEEKLNMYVWKTTTINPMGFRTEWFGEYKQQFKDCEREVLSILADEKSKDIILNRVNFGSITNSV